MSEMRSAVAAAAFADIFGDVFTDILSDKFADARAGTHSVLLLLFLVKCTQRRVIFADNLCSVNAICLRMSRNRVEFTINIIISTFQKFWLRKKKKSIRVMFPGSGFENV